jgi:hypothetical protein
LCSKDKGAKIGKEKEEKRKEASLQGYDKVFLTSAEKSAL